MPSRQLQQYLASRATGATIDESAKLAGFSLTEARLTEKAIEAGDVEMPRAPAHAHTREDQSTKEEGMAREDVKTSIRVNDGPEVPLDLDKGLDHPDNAAAKEQMGHIVENVVANAATRTGEQIKRYIERVERLDTEIKDLNGDKSDLFKEMKSNGFDTTTIKRIIKLRKMETHKRQEAEALLETYMNAIGMTPIEAAIALAA